MFAHEPSTSIPNFKTAQMNGIPGFGGIKPIKDLPDFRLEGELEPAKSEFYCTICNSTVDSDAPPTICPNCGGKNCIKSTGKTHDREPDAPKPIKTDPRQWINPNLPLVADNKTEVITAKRKVEPDKDKVIEVKKIRKVDDKITGEEFKQVIDPDEQVIDKNKELEVWQSCLDLEIDG